jgi:hypothetical protein
VNLKTKLIFAMDVNYIEQIRLEDLEWHEERKRLSKLEWKCVLDTAYLEGYAKGYTEAKNSIIINCFSLGIAIEEIADLSTVSGEYVNETIQNSDSNKNRI